MNLICEAAAQFMASVIFGAILTLLIKVGVAFAGHSIAWWAAALIGFVIAFGGCFLLDLDDLGGWWS